MRGWKHCLFLYYPVWMSHQSSFSNSRNTPQFYSKILRSPKRMMNQDCTLLPLIKDSVSIPIRSSYERAKRENYLNNMGFSGRGENQRFVGPSSLKRGRLRKERITRQSGGDWDVPTLLLILRLWFLFFEGGFWWTGSEALGERLLIEALQLLRQGGFGWLPQRRGFGRRFPGGGGRGGSEGGSGCGDGRGREVGARSEGFF